MSKIFDIISNPNSDNDQEQKNTKITPDSSDADKFELALDFLMNSEYQPSRKEQRRRAKTKSPKNSITLYTVAPIAWAKYMRNMSAVAATIVSAPEDSDEYKEASAIYEEALPYSPLTFVTSKEEAVHYCDHFYFYKYYKHFSLWCASRSLLTYDKDAWNKYLYDCVYPTEQQDADNALAVFVSVYPVKTFASILRIYSGAFPLGLTWEEEEEKNPFFEEHKNVEKELNIQQQKTFNKPCVQEVLEGMKEFKHDLCKVCEFKKSKHCQNAYNEKKESLANSAHCPIINM